MLPVGEASPKPYPASKPPRRFPMLLVLLAAGCLTTMTGGIVAPVLPEMEQQLHLPREWAGLLVSMHALTTALFTPLLGIVADRVGKLKVMLPSLICYAIFGTSGAFLHQFVPLLIARGLLGASSGGVAAASIGLLGTMYEGEARSRVLGYATSAMTTAAILIPVVGGWVGSQHWQYSFYLYGFGVPLAFVAAAVLREKRSNQASVIGANQRSSLIKILRQRQILELYLLLAFAALIVYAVVIYTPIYLKATIGAGPELNGIVLGIRAIGAAVISALGAARLAKLLGTHRAIAVGFTLMSLTLVTIPFLNQIEWILPTAVLFGIGFGIITPNTYNALASRTPAELRASVLAIGTGANSLGQFISPIILGPVRRHFELPAVFYVAGAIALSMAILSLIQSRGAKSEQ